MRRTGGGEQASGSPYLNTVSLLDSDSIDTFIPSGAGSLQASTIYSRFDALVSSFPKYVTRTLLGSEATSSLPIYEYAFKPEEISHTVWHLMDGPVFSKLKNKKVLIVAGIHGIEKEGPWSLIHLFERICNDWASSETLEFFRHNIEFRVVPIMNPWGFNNYFRENKPDNPPPNNSWDLNRQWSPTYAGPIQPEVYAVKAFIDNNADADLFIDCHTQENGQGQNTVYFNTPGGNMNKLASSLLRKLTRKWKAQYPIIPATYDPETGNELMGKIDYNTDPAWMINYVYNVANIKNCVLLEAATKVTYESEDGAAKLMTSNIYFDLLANTLVAYAVKFGASYSNND